MGLMCTFIYSPYNYHSGEFFVPLDNVVKRIPFAFFVVLTGTLIAYRYIFDRKVVVCPNCGHVKNQDKVANCSCGGVYADLDEYKWNRQISRKVE